MQSEPPADEEFHVTGWLGKELCGLVPEDLTKKWKEMTGKQRGTK
jgi:hypothetical protein